MRRLTLEFANPINLRGEILLPGLVYQFFGVLDLVKQSNPK